MTRTTEIIVECKHLHSFFLVQLLFNLGDTMMSAIKRQKVASALKSRFIAVHCTEKHHLKSNLNMKDNITRLNFFMWTYLISYKNDRRNSGGTLRQKENSSKSSSSNSNSNRGITVLRVLRVLRVLTVLRVIRVTRVIRVIRSYGPMVLRSYRS